MKTRPAFPLLAANAYVSRIEQVERSALRMRRWCYTLAFMVGMESVWIIFREATR